MIKGIDWVRAFAFISFPLWYCYSPSTYLATAPTPSSTTAARGTPSPLLPFP